uniref:Uncharacterized protein n=1 Tax=Lygus hesperus TaxID=30085 RepID=A0A146M178_LYGHE
MSKAMALIIRDNRETGIYKSAKDWTFLCTFKNFYYTFPKSLDFCFRVRPDIIYFSEETKQLIIVEITVPWEMNLSIAHFRKTAKYRRMVNIYTDHGFDCRFYSVEVGCRGVISKSLSKFFTDIGLKKDEIDYYVKLACKTSLEYSKNMLCPKPAEPQAVSEGDGPSVPNVVPDGVVHIESTPRKPKQDAQVPTAHASLAQASHSRTPPCTPRKEDANDGLLAWSLPQTPEEPFPAILTRAPSKFKGRSLFGSSRDQSVQTEISDSSSSNLARRCSEARDSLGKPSTSGSHIHYK